MLASNMRMRIFEAFLATAVILAATAGLLAQDNVWRGSGTGTTAPDPDNPGTDCDVFSGWGGGQVGNYNADGCHMVDPNTGMFDGSATWTTANGDTLNVTYDGQIFPSGDPDFPFGFFGTLNANGGTGDLANASGSAPWSGGFSGVPGNFYFNFDGTLNTAGNFHTVGIVQFSNILGALGAGEPAPYVAPGYSSQIGLFVQTGSILPTSAPEVDLIRSTPETTVLHFNGVQGPNPYFFGLPIHVYLTRRGLIFCHWEALFTIEIENATGNAVFSGDGYFTVDGGIGWYHHATGTFQTLFVTGVVPPGSDTALASYRQDGRLDR